MDAASYDAWYQSDFGKWVGKTELDLIVKNLDPKPHETLLDIGCGTGYFTRHIAPFVAKVMGVDLDSHRLDFAKSQFDKSAFLLADATNLPFGDKSFDISMAITSLGFVQNQAKALAEIKRVTKKRAVIAVLNRDSKLWHLEGKNGGTGGYKGAHWHSASELNSQLLEIGAKHIALSSVVDGVSLEECKLAQNDTLKGAFLLASFDID